MNGFKRLLLPSLLAFGLLATFYIALASVAARDASGDLLPLYNANGLDFVLVQTIPNTSGRDAAFGDLDDNGTVDIVVANHNAPSRVLLNDGSGNFSQPQTLAKAFSEGVAIGDINNDTHLDIVIANINGLNRVWLNNGSGLFPGAGQTFDSADSYDVTLGNLDGDSDLDVYFANGNSNPASTGNTIWLNQGGIFVDSGQSLGSSWSESVALGDFDGINGLDAFIANGQSSSNSNRVWLNDGSGGFTSTVHLADFSWSRDVALAQLDGDNFLDAMTVNWFPHGTNKVWLNLGDGSGHLTDTQTFGGISAASTSISLADVDDDNDVDALVGNWVSTANEIWLNNGTGSFNDSGLALGIGGTRSVNLTNLDGDNDPDALIVYDDRIEIWSNGISVPTPSFDVDSRRNEAGIRVYPWTQASNAILPVMLSSSFPQPLDVLVNIDRPIGDISDTVSFNAGQMLNNLIVNNPMPAESETYTLTLAVNLAQTAASLPSTLVEGDLGLVFINQGQGPQFCILCFTDWMLKLLGFQPTFWALHHTDIEDRMDEILWAYYTGLVQQHTSELSIIVATNPSILWDGFDMLETWTPAAEGFKGGQSNSVKIEQQWVDKTTDLMLKIQSKASSELAQTIQTELVVLDLDSYVGLTMDEAVNRLNGRTNVHMPFVAK